MLLGRRIYRRARLKGSIKEVEVDAWPRRTPRARLMENAGMRVVLRTGGAHEGRPLVIAQLNELESMEKDLLCVCVYVSATIIGT